MQSVDFSTAIPDRRTDSHMAGRRWRRDKDRMCTVIPTTFVFSGGNAPQAQRVALLGALNGLNAISHPLTKTLRGDWAITVYLPAGRTVYGFDVDGTFWLDPFDEARMSNGWGSEYSIRFVRPSA